MKDHQEKTNAMRILERNGVPYESFRFETKEAVSGVEAAAILGQDPERVFKTLVTKGKSGAHCVFVIPVAKELDLKKAAAAAGEKSVEMIPQKELFPLTGYVHGGCSPIGMKKQFLTVLDCHAEGKPLILFSAGKIGWQVGVSPEGLRSVTGCKVADLCR
ncbi:MAG: Cys-tRNA(Pro) deacylase [Clostridia bacterium]|nr:Cys-tRNA(Pro) deacylase [Clostridia bacterium]